MIQSSSLGWSLPFQEHIPNEQDRYWIQNIARQLPFLADFIPADLLIHCPVSEQQFVTVAEARPTVRQRSTISSADQAGGVSVSTGRPRPTDSTMS